jgi:hypothetical protein
MIHVVPLFRSRFRYSRATHGNIGAWNEARSGSRDSNEPSAIEGGMCNFGHTAPGIRDMLPVVVLPGPGFGGSRRGY